MHRCGIARSLFERTFRKSTPLYMLYGEMGRRPIEHTFKCRMINYWYRIITGKQSKLITGKQFKLTYLLNQKLIHTPGLKSKWVMKIKQILEECGRPDIWYCQSPNNTTGIIVKRILGDQFLQNWVSNLQQSSKGRNYNIYKNTLDMESNRATKSNVY